MNSSQTHESYADRPHILVVDDDDRIRSLVSKYLNEHGFLCIPASDAASALELLESFECDAMVADIMMPQVTGLELTQRLREEGGRLADLPIILLTALGEGTDRIKGFESGADDYLPKPFEPMELVLRLKALLKRSASAKAPDAFSFGPWNFIEEQKALKHQDGKKDVVLTDAEILLLKSLASKRGEVVSRDELAQLCGVEAGERTIDVQVTRLRRKIEEDTKAPLYLQTVRGKGYLLRVSL